MVKETQRSRRRRQNFVQQSVVSPANAEPRHFFKLIRAETINARNMRIPKEFVRRFGNELSTGEATIGVSDGRVWKMELKKSEDEAWFCNGWEEFMKHYSVSLGFFLAFKYEGDSQFNVLIFDASAAEIHYPFKDHSKNQNSVSEGRRKRSQRHKKEDEEEIIDTDDEKDSCGQEQGHCSRTKKKGVSKKQRALEPANASFTKTVRASNLKRCYLDVPSSFWKENMGKMGAKMNLEDDEGQKWEANYAKCASSIRIWKGWIGLARAKNVKEGDVCVFELIKRKGKKGYAFKVTVIAC